MIYPIISKIKAHFVFWVALLFTTGLSAQQPQPVPSLVKEIKSKEWYEEQANAWKKITQRNPKDAAAWFNYYMANRMMRIYDEAGDVQPTDRFKVLNGIVDQMKKHIPDSYEYHYTVWYNSYNDPATIASLETAYRIDPSRTESYSGLATHHEINGNQNKRDGILRKWYTSQDPIPGLLNYNYNVLASLDRNAILLTAGDNDTYPAWILQAAKHIRPDVRVLNVHLLMMDDYRKRIFAELGIPDLPLNDASDKDERQLFRKNLVAHLAKNEQNRPVYIAVTASNGPETELIQEKLYLVGLAYRYSDQKIDNIALIRKNFEQQFMLDYVKKPLAYEPFQQVVDLANGNYVVPGLNLYEHYRAAGEKEKATNLKALCLQLGEKAGFGEQVKAYFDNLAEEHEIAK